MIDTYIKLCERNHPGNRALFLIDVGDITTVEITDGEVSDIDLGFGDSFKKIEADLDTIQRQQNAQTSRVVQSFRHAVSFTVSNLRTATNDLSNELKIASRCGIAAIVIDSNQQTWLVGWNYIEAYSRALFLKTEDDNSEENTAVYNLETLSEVEDLPLDDTLNEYALDKFYIGATEMDFNLDEPSGLVGMDGQQLEGMDGQQLIPVDP